MLGKIFKLVLGKSRALAIAAERDDIAEAKSLLDQGAEVNRRDKMGWTPLHRAASGKMAELLLAKDADVNAKDNDGDTPLHRAASLGKRQVAKVLLRNGANVNARGCIGMPLHRAARNGHQSTVRLLIDSGGRVNAKDEINNTPLHKAAKNGHQSTARLLLDNGARVNAKNHIDSTPLHEAAEHGHKGIVKLLLAKGADVSAESLRYTRLQRGFEKGHTIMCELLGGMHTPRYLPVHLAAEEGHTAISKMLLAKAAELEGKPLKEVKREVWAASPTYNCGVCGKELRGLSGGLIMGSSKEFLEMMLELNRYICPNCGFISCFKCCADPVKLKVICKRCSAKMFRG